MKPPSSQTSIKTSCFVVVLLYSSINISKRKTCCCTRTFIIFCQICNNECESEENKTWIHRSLFCLKIANSTYALKLNLVSSYYFSSIADSLFQVGSIYSTLALSVERYLAVVYPFTVYR